MARRYCVGNQLIRYQINTEFSLVIASVQGDIAFNDMLQYLYKLIQDPKYQPGMNSFYDLTECTNITGELADLSEFTRSLRNRDHNLPESKTAVLLPEGNETLLNLVKGIVMMTSASTIEHRYFSDSQRNLAFEFVGFKDSADQDLTDIFGLKNKTVPKDKPNPKTRTFD